MSTAWHRPALWLALLLGLASLALTTLLAAALQGEPAVVSSRAPDHADVARALALVRQHDPRHRPPGRRAALALSERDLDVLLNHVAHRWLRGAARAVLKPRELGLTLSLQAPPNPFGRWLNVHLQLREAGTLPEVASAQLGRLPLPRWLAAWLLQRAARHAGLADEWRLAAGVVQRVTFSARWMLVVYAWRADSADRMLGALLPQDLAQRLRGYNDRLVELANLQGPNNRAPLAFFVGPLFEMAKAHSTSDDDAAVENRAALLALTMYANGLGLDALWPAARSWPRPRAVRLTLAGRDDFTLHLLVSAVLAAEGTSPLSKAVGVYKEVADARRGSGFSFNDIAADRAGTRLGEWALSRPRDLQERLARGVRDEDLMPPWSDLPEFMPDAEFRRRFGGVGAPAYQAMLDEIDRRVAALPLFR